MFAHRSVAQLLHQMQMFGRIVVVEQFQCCTIEFTCTAHSQIILVAIGKDAHITTDLILEANSQSEQLWNFLAV